MSTSSSDAATGSGIAGVDGGSRRASSDRSRRWPVQAVGDFRAKDFRTWNATAFCAVALAAHLEQAMSRISRERVVRAAIDEVAELLGNMPAVCRVSYVDPPVIDRFHAGLTIADSFAARPGASIAERVRRAVLDLIAGDEDVPGVEARRPAP